MAAQSQSSPIPSHMAPCPTCSCPRSHSHSLPQPQPPLSSPVPKTLTPNPPQHPTLKSTQPKLHEAPRSRLFDALRFPQPRVLASSPAPTPVSNPAPNQVSAPALTPVLAPALTPVSAPAQPESAVVSGSPPPVPSQSNATDLTSSSSNPNSLLECNTYKSRLHSYAQRSSIPIPEYRTVNEGLIHAPRFRSSVDVDGVTYTAQNTFSHRKAAEQDVAKLAMECILKKIKNEGCPLIHEDTVFCKSILNEFAVKMNLPTVTYKTVQSEALIPIFASSLVVNGITYMGDPGKNKKEAEQMAARSAIISLMGDSGFGTALSEIIKSKEKLYDALYKKQLNYIREGIVSAGGNTESDNGTPRTQNLVVEPYVPTMCQPITDIQESPVVAVSAPISAAQEAFVTAASQPIGAAQNPVVAPNVRAMCQPITEIQESPIAAASTPISAAQEALATVVSHPIGTAPSACARVQPPRHEFRVPKLEISSGAINPPTETVLPNVQRFIAFTPPAQQPVGAVPDLGSKRRRKNKKRSSKKARVGAQ